MADNRWSAEDWFRLIVAIIWFAVLVIKPRLTAAITLLLIGGAFIAFNAWVFWQTVIRKAHAPAVAPIFGGILAAAGVALLPVDGIWKWAWVPLLIDWGGLPMYLVAWHDRRDK